MSAASLALVASTGGCGLFAKQTDFDALKTQNVQLAQQVQADATDVAQLKQELKATKERLDNALRANADTGSDILSSKARINDIAGRADELAHAIDEIKKSQLEQRTEIDTKLDALTRGQAATQAVTNAPAPPPVKIPEDKATHYQSVVGAFTQKDWPLVRSLGHEYVNRYATDDHADDVQCLLGEADLADNRPSSALGEFNRLLKVYPRSDKLDRALYDMGDAYVQLHDCDNAKLAYGAVEQRFPREPLGKEAKKQLQTLERPAPGTCAPQGAVEPSRAPR